MLGSVFFYIFYEKDFGVSQPTMVGILNRLVQKDLVLHLY